MAQRAAAGARAVLGLGVRAAQPAEVKHQAAKEFFKEVRHAGLGWRARWERAQGRWRCAALRRLPPPACLLVSSSPVVSSSLQVCRCLPWVLKNYRLEELTTVYELRRNVASLFKKYASVEVRCTQPMACGAKCQP